MERTTSPMSSAAVVLISPLSRGRRVSGERLPALLDRERDVAGERLHIGKRRPGARGWRRGGCGRRCGRGWRRRSLIFAPAWRLCPVRRRWRLCPVRPWRLGPVRPRRRGRPLGSDGRAPDLVCSPPLRPPGRGRRFLVMRKGRRIGCFRRDLGSLRRALILNGPRLRRLADGRRPIASRLQPGAGRCGAFGPGFRLGCLERPLFRRTGLGHG